MNKIKIKAGTLVSIIASSTTEYFDIVGNPDESKQLKKNDLVNIEIDIFSKYVRNYFNEK